MPYIPMLMVSLCMVVALGWKVVSKENTIHHREDLKPADKRLAIYWTMYAKALDGPERMRTQKQVNIIHTIYHNVAHAYNLC